jgi:hypothetical protein
MTEAQAFSHTGKHPDVGDHTAVGVVEGIEDRATQQLVRVFHGRGDSGDDGRDDFREANAGLGGGRNAILGGNAEDFLELLLALRHVGTSARRQRAAGSGQVDLIKDRDLMVMSFSRSKSIESSCWALVSRMVTVFVTSIRRSESVVLP